MSVLCSRGLCNSLGCFSHAKSYRLTAILTLFVIVCDISVAFELSGCQVNHLYATSTRDGATVYHRAVQFADKLQCLNLLLSADQAAINVQDSSGLSPLHVACKLSRRTVVKKLVV